jgi:hypothetical protein
MDMKNSKNTRFSTVQKFLIGVLILGLIGCIALLFENVQSFIISLVGKIVFHRSINNPLAAQQRLGFFSFLGIASCVLLSMVVLFHPKRIEGSLDKLIHKTWLGVSVKRMITEQPFALIAFVFVLYLVKNISLAANITGFDGFVLLAAVLVHSGILVIMHRKNHANPLPHLAVCYMLLIFAFAINAMIFDHSWDGRMYHQVAAQYLRNGWNPFYANLPETGVFIWNNHYPKFTELFNSIFLSIFGNIELGKAYNIIFLIITFCCALRYTGKYHKNKLVVLTVSVLVVMNPVVLAQLFTYYVDGLLGMLIIILFFACIDYEREQNIKDMVIIIAVSVFAINTKFTGFICGIVLIGYIIRQLALKRYKQMIMLIIAGVVILAAGVLFAGYNPYIVNARDFGNPFYPIYGNNKIDIIYIDGIMPEELLPMHPIQRFFSLFLLNYDIISLPFNPLKSIKLISHSTVDLRIGGFGVLFIEIFIFVIFIVYFSIKKNKDCYKTVLFPAVLLLCISLIMPENWWARYIPFFWYLPGFFIMASDYRVKKNRFLFFPLSAIIIINSFSFFVFNTMNGILYTINMKQFLTDIKKSGKDTIHIIVDAEYFKYAIMEKIMVYDIDKNIIFIGDKEAPFTNGVSIGNIKGWY